MQSIVERLPRSWAYALAVLAARFAWMFSPLARPRLDYNLAIVCPELTPVELRKLSWVNFRNHAKAYADLMMLPRMNVEAMRPLMHVDGLENLAHARAMGKGVLVVSCHMGSYEVASAIWSATVSPVSLFAEELEPRADEVRVTQELLRHIEGFIRRHPEQWHVPHRIWEGAP